MRRWEFPKPLGGGSVIVSYPFILNPAPMVLVAGTGSNRAGAVTIDWIDDRAMIHRSADGNGVPSNGLIVVIDRGLLLVDTAWTEPQTAAILRFGQERLRRPWLGAVITHEHNDRDGGIGTLLREHIPVAALDLTVARLARRGVHGVTTLFAATAGQFHDPRGFEAFYPGPGHAADNIVLAFSSPNLVFGGCLIKSSDAKDLGFTGDADLAAWPAAVRRVAEKYPKPFYLVSGHGDVDKSGSAYGHTLDLLLARPPTSTGPSK